MSVLSSTLRRLCLRRSVARKQQDDGGFVAIEFVAGMGFLLLPVALLVMAFPTWAERQGMARVAAREAARSFALSADPATAQAAVDQIEANYGLPDNTMVLNLSGFPALPIRTGDVVTATVVVTVPALNVGLWEISSASFDLTETHSEPVDLYRSRSAS